MKKYRTIIVSRSNDYTTGGFGFTVRHFVIYPPSVTVNDILRASYSVVIDEHQQKLLETGANTNRSLEGTTNPSGILSSSVGLIHHQGEQQRSSSSLSTTSQKICPNDSIQDDGTNSINSTNSNLQSIDTIFVKEVRQDGPAYQAGLRQGDRILTINGQSIHGKTYSQVIAMIQNAPADLVLNVLPKEDETNTSNFPEQIPINPSTLKTNKNTNESRLKPYSHSSLSLSFRPSMSTSMTNNTIEQKLRNLQINLAQGRTADQLAQAGIYFPQPSSSSTSTGGSLMTLPSASTTSNSLTQQNLFSNYIDSVHRALDSSKEKHSNKSDCLPCYGSSSYHHDYIHYDYQRMSQSNPYENNYNENIQSRNFLNQNGQINLNNIRQTSIPPRSNLQYLDTNKNHFLNLSTNQSTGKTLNRLDDEQLSINSKSSSTLTKTNEPWTNEQHYSSDSKRPGNSIDSNRNDIKSPSTTDSTMTEQTSTNGNSSNEKSPSNENEMKTEFVNFRKKQFETGHVENILHDSQRESKTKKYSEKKKYENEWNRLTAIADVESVLDRASHFEDIDRDKFARLKSKLPSSPPTEENLFGQEQFFYQFNPNNLNQFYSNQTNQPMKFIRQHLNQNQSSIVDNFRLNRGNNENNHSFNYEPHFIMESVQNQSNPTTSNKNSQFPIENYSMRNPSTNHFIGSTPFFSQIRPSTTNDQPQFVTEFDNPLRVESTIKENQRRLIIPNGQRNNYLENKFPAIIRDSTRKENENYSFGLIDDSTSKQRTRSPNQTQAIKKLKHFFGENTRQLIEQIEDRPSSCQSPLSAQSSSGGQSKSGSFFDGSTADGNSNTRESISLTTMPEHFEPSKEGILYCKMVMKEGRRSADRSWRGAWAVLRRGALFLGKEKKHGLLIPLSCDSFPINLQNADVELANDYIKKPRVFKLITSNQSEFLFQAPDIQSLNEWLEVLNEHTFTSQSIQSTDRLNNDQRQSTTSLPPSIPDHLNSTTNKHSPIREINEKRKSSSTTSGTKSKISIRSPSLKRSPSIRFRKSHKSSINSSSSIITNSNSNETNSTVQNSTGGGTSPRRSFVKSIVKKGLRTLKSSSSLLTSQMSGQIYDESSGESLNTGSVNSQINLGMNFSIELEECESSSISRFIPIVVEILTRLVELRGINYQGIYRHAGGLTAVNWLVNELDKGADKIDFNSEKWYDVKAVASTLKTFFAKLPDSLLSSKLSSLSVEASRLDNHCHRLVQLKKILVQLDDHRFETLKYLCAHFRRVASKCDINKIDARNLAIIFGPTLIWDSKASLQSNLVDNPEKIRIIESFIIYYEWFFDDNEFNSIPVEINPQMPKLPSIESPINEIHLNNETKPGEIIQHIVFAAKRRWSSSMLIEGLSSLTSNNEQQTGKSINISVKSVVRPN